MVGKYAIDENYAHYYGTPRLVNGKCIALVFVNFLSLVQYSEKAYYTSKFKDVFYVQTVEWKRKIVYRGLKLFVQVSTNIIPLRLTNILTVSKL